MGMNNKIFKKYLVESALIILSLLLALSIDKFMDEHERSKQKDFAIEQIQKELERNLEIIDQWIVRHQATSEIIQGLVDGTDEKTKTELRKQPFFDFGVLTERQSLVDTFLISTAWDTAKATGIISEFPFDTTQTLTSVYSLQEVISNKSLNKIIDFYFDMEAHKMENLDQILIQFQLRFGTLVSQEYILKYLYKEALTQLKGNSRQANESENQ